MDIEFAGLPEELENYRNRMSAFYWNKTLPPKIGRKWNSEIEPANLYSLGEDGADRYLQGRNLGEESLIYFALQAENFGHLEMANGFWKRAYLKAKSSGEALYKKKTRTKPAKVRQHQEQSTSKFGTTFQELWFTLVREQRKYSCYSIFLALPSDKEAIRYLQEYGDDLKIISSPSTLVMMVGNDHHLHVDVNNERLSVEISRDYARIAHLFSVDFTTFPCMVVFESMNSSTGIPVMLKGMTAEEISEKMKMFFSIVQKAVREKKSPLETLQQHKNDERFRHAGKAVLGTVRSFLGYTYKTIIEELTRIYAPKPGNQ